MTFLCRTPLGADRKGTARLTKVTTSSGSAGFVSAEGSLLSFAWSAARLIISAPLTTTALFAQLLDQRTTDAAFNPSALSGYRLSSHTLPGRTARKVIRPGRRERLMIGNSWSPRPDIDRSSVLPLKDEGMYTTKSSIPLVVVLPVSE